MNNRDRYWERRLDDSAWTQLAFGFNGGGPPGGGAQAAAGSPPRDPSLTQEFNAAAKKPVLYDVAKQPDYKRMIDALRRQMSQPRNTFEMTPLGSVNKAINCNRDRWMQETIDSLTELKNVQQSQQTTRRQRLGLAARAGEAKRDFNRAAKGIGM